MEQLSKADILSLIKLNFSFYTVLLNLSSINWQDEFRKANSEAKGLKVPMQVILQFGTEVDKELAEFIELCQTVFPFIEEVIILQNGSKVTPSGLLHKTLPFLREGLHHVKIGIGSYSDLEEIVKQKPDLNEADFLSLPFQNGTFLDSSENSRFNIQHQIELIRALKSASSSRHLYVIPNSLNTGLSIFNENPPDFLRNEQLKMSFLDISGKAISNFKSILFAGADSISFYENGGKIDIFSADHSNIKFENLKSIPFFYLLTEVLEMNNGFIIEAENSSSSKIDALILNSAGRIKAILINLSPERQAISLGGISLHSKIKILDVDFIKELFTNSEEIEKSLGLEMRFHNARANIMLQPFCIAVIIE